MKWTKRIFLFLAVNFLVMVTISLVTNLLGVKPYLHKQGIDYTQLMLFCLVWGFGGAFISLLLSKTMAKWMMGVKVIDPQTHNQTENHLLQTVHRLATQAGISRMPEVGIYDSPEVNAFATGPTKNRALVAVSSGLLQRMSPAQVEGVLGHEVAHVANGDMVTMTLVQGIINAFVMFFARIIAYAASQFVREDSRRMVQMLVTIVLEIAFSILGAMVVATFSRWREFRADAGGANLAGRGKMIEALKGLQRTLEIAQVDDNQAVAAFKISGKKNKFLQLLSTHPPLEERIRRLENSY